MLIWLALGLLIGEMTGILTTAIVSGIFDDIMEWRKKRHEQKRKNRA